MYIVYTLGASTSDVFHLKNVFVSTIDDIMNYEYDQWKLKLLIIQHCSMKHKKKSLTYAEHSIVL